MNILGISCFYHDSAACLVRDGEIIAAAQEERFTRKKHDFNFPQNAINWCLQESGISAKDVDYSVFYKTPSWIKQKFWIPKIIRKQSGYQGRILFCNHHESEAANAFYPSPFKESAFLTIGAAGEGVAVSFGVGRDREIKTLRTLRFPHSPGLLYSAFTYYLGFKIDSGEYKVMGLAPYGEPKYTDLILKELINFKKDGFFRLNMRYFDCRNKLRMINQRFERLFGGPPRDPETTITQSEIDIAASIQKATEEIVLRLVRQVHKATCKDKLCQAGGVALNCVANGRMVREGPFKEVWIQPASGDAGAALGAALLIWYKYLGNARIADGENDLLKGSLLGPGFSDDDIENFLNKEKAHYRELSDTDIPGIVSDLLMQGKVMGWFQGKLEFGPRALGSRSILGDARNPDMQSIMNQKIKYRESFRPLAPSVLKEEASKWFELDRESPYMLIVAPVKDDKRLALDDRLRELAGLDKLKLRRSQIAAVTHVDYSARIQTVDRKVNPLYYDTINAFFKKTGCPVIINTSFNVRGEPLVCSPEDAFRCFMRTEMDYLMMGSFLLDKKGQIPLKKDIHWQEVFELD